MPNANASRMRSLSRRGSARQTWAARSSAARRCLKRSRDWTGFRADAFRDALSCSLDLLGTDALREDRDEHGRRVWRFPALDARERDRPELDRDARYLRAPRKRNQKLAEWRREAPIRPVVFEDAGVLTDEVVHLHLEQRVAQRLLARFRSQASSIMTFRVPALAQTTDPIPRVLLLGRLSLYGRGAERLHEEIVTLTARWVEPSRRSPALVPYAREAESRTLELLQATLSDTARSAPSERCIAGCSKAPLAMSTSCCPCLRSAPSSSP